MMNKLLVGGAHINDKGEKLFWIETEFDHELRKIGIFKLNYNDELEPSNFSFGRMYDREIDELLLQLVNNIKEIKTLFNYPQYSLENRFLIKI